MVPWWKPCAWSSSHMYRLTCHPISHACGITCLDLRAVSHHRRGVSERIPKGAFVQCICSLGGPLRCRSAVQGCVAGLAGALERSLRGRASAGALSGAVQLFTSRTHVNVTFAFDLHVYTTIQRRFNRFMSELAAPDSLCVQAIWDGNSSGSFCKCLTLVVCLPPTATYSYVHSQIGRPGGGQFLRDVHSV